MTAFTQDDNKQFVNDSTHEVSFGQIKQVRIAWVQSQELEKENSFLYKEIDNYSLQVDNYQSIIIQKDSIKSLLDREIQLLQLANNASNEKINADAKTIKRLKIECDFLGGLSIILLLGLMIK